MGLSKNESVYFSVQKVEWQYIDSTDWSSKTTPFRSSKLPFEDSGKCDKSILSYQKEVTFYTVHAPLLKKKLPSDLASSIFCCWKASDRFPSAVIMSVPWLPEMIPRWIFTRCLLWPRWSCQQGILSKRLGAQALPECCWLAGSIPERTRYSRHAVSGASRVQWHGWPGKANPGPPVAGHSVICITPCIWLLGKRHCQGASRLSAAAR